jgi:ABC-2 type transport system ATP-binding protein
MTEQAEGKGPALEVKNLRYAYGSSVALKGVTFSVKRGSIHGFVGPNGAGKTTTLKILATLLQPQGGHAYVFGNDVTDRDKAVRRRTGFMPEEFSLYRQMTVFECLDFFAAAYGLGLTERDRLIDDVLALTDMEGRRDDYIKNLSHGMMQRVSLARTLIHDPDLLLLDEPAAGLDPRARIELVEIFRELSRMGKTIFISSHILGELADLCDSVTIIDRGSVKYCGPMADLLYRRGDRASYVVALREENPPTEKALQELDGMLSVERMDGDATYRITFDMRTTDTNAVVKAVMESGGHLASFREGVRKLSEAFLELTEPGVPS